MLESTDTTCKPFRNRKFITSLIVSFLIFWFLIFFLIAYKSGKEEWKIAEIETLLKWGISTYKESFWYYPANIYKLEQEGILSPLDLLLEKSWWVKFIYNKTLSWYSLTNIKK